VTGRRTAALLAAALALGGGPAAAQTSDRLLPDWLQLDLRGYADLRLVHTPAERNWNAGGLGKVRYGGSESGAGTGLRPGELSLVGAALLPGGLQAVAHVRAEPEQRTAVDVVEAYLRWRPVSTSRWRWAVKAGAFFPPVSLENDGVAWTSRYTLTPSAINSWVGEELRTIGAEGRLEWRGETDRLEAVAALFGWNDPAGTMLAYGGWHFTDRPTGLIDRLQVPNEVQFHRGRIPPGYTDVAREIDDRAGYYAGASWRRDGVGRLAVLRYDNRARPDAFRSVFAWDTRFWSIGAAAEPLPGLTLLAQGLRGATIVTPSAAAHSRTRYQAAYLLASLELDRWRLSLRGDVFATRERSPAPRVELSEHGTAMTAAVSYRLAAGVRLTGEVLRVDSYRLQRTAVQLPARAVETQAQLAVRLYF
jgi:hypothetical protein